MAVRVQVVVRLRPINETERRVAGAVAVSQEGDGIVVHGERSRHHTFDKAFGVESSQDELFHAVGSPAVSNVLKGYNATLLAYGQTGSGKTHTMLGPSGGNVEVLDERSALFVNRGLIPRVVESLFEHLTALDVSEFTWSVVVSVCELYKEQLHDSLVEVEMDPSQYRIREDVSGGRGIYVENLYEKPCTTASEVLQAIKVGATRRRVAATMANETSSRSHSITLVTLKMTNHLLGDAVTYSRFTLVDLAGSEKVAKTNAGGERLKEAQSINLSLTLLGNVIYKLTDGKSSYIPYRDSKLTRLLQDSLGGNSCTTLLCCASPAQHNKEETISTLAFAARAKQITNKPRINRDLSEAELKTALARALEEITSLKDHIGMQAELLQRTNAAQRSPHTARRAPSTASEVDDDRETERDTGETDLRLVIERLIAENADLTTQLQAMRDKLSLAEVQVEFHRERANKAEEKNGELQAKLRREESLFERRVAELSTATLFVASGVAPTAPTMPDVTTKDLSVATRGASMRRTAPRSVGRQPVEDPRGRRTSMPSVESLEVTGSLLGRAAPATDASLQIEIDRLMAEISKIRLDLERQSVSEKKATARVVTLERMLEDSSASNNDLLQQLEEVRLTLSATEQRNADMKRILDALNIDVEEQLTLERQRTAQASSEADALRGKNTELVEAQSQQEFCDIASAELLFKAEDMEAIENEVVAIRFSRAPVAEIEQLRASCNRTLSDLSDFLTHLLSRINDRRFATANLETCRLNIIAEGLSLQDRVVAAQRRLR